MSTTDNPYTPPTAALDGDAPPGFAATGEVPAAVIALLGQTRPWVKLLSVLFFVSLALIGVVGVVVAVIRPGMAPGVSALAFLPLLIILLLYIPPSLYLWRYARGIRRLESGGGLGALEEALTNQKSFWKFTGVLALVMVCIYAIALVGGGFVGIFARSRGT